VQSSLLSLFSSTGSDPLQLFSQQVDKDLPEDSFIHLLNDTTNDPAPAPPRKLIHSTSAQGDSDNGNATQRTTLCQTVLHIQSPTIRSTFVRCPALSDLSGGTRRSTLGLKHPWVHLQVRNLEHEWAFEVGVVDALKSPGTMRFSTFQKEISVKPSHDPPLLLIPLRFPSEDSNPLTAWMTISIDLSSMMRHFQSAASDHLDRSSDSSDVRDSPQRPAHLPANRSPLPSSHFASTDYIKIYANCRLRRVWFSEDKAMSSLPWEFQLYGAVKR